MARVADKPGSFRVMSRKAGGVLLSGVRNSGERVKLKFATKAEAESFASSSGLFTVKPELPQADWAQTDDWGFPVRVSADTAANVNAKLGIPKPEDIKPAVDKVATAIQNLADESGKREKRAQRASQAKSLMEMIGMAGAMGDVMLAERITKAAGKVPVKANPQQVRDLSDSLKETLVEWFGDRDVKPWQMTILLALGIPLTMLLQSKPVEKPTQATSSAQSATK